VLIKLTGYEWRRVWWRHVYGTSCVDRRQLWSPHCHWQVWAFLSVVHLFTRSCCCRC